MLRMATDGLSSLDLSHVHLPPDYVVAAQRVSALKFIALFHFERHCRGGPV